MTEQEDRPWVIVELLLDRISDDDVGHLQVLLTAQDMKRGLGRWNANPEEETEKEICQLKEYQSTFSQIPGGIE